ncbi:4673_t:CDS:2, partial [Racocetra persica]
RLYGTTLTCDNVIEETSSQLVFEADQNGGFRSPYTMRKIGIGRELYQLLQPIINQFVSKHPVVQQENYYLVNILTEESRLFNNIEDNKTTLDIVKNELVQYF